MNELELLRAVNDETPLLDLADLSTARGRLACAISGERVRERRGPRRRRGRRLAFVAGALAAACAVAVVVFGPFAHRYHGRPPVAVSPAPGPGAGHPTAAEVLGRAAFVALHTASVAPRPDQFVYTKVQATGGGVTQSWLSVDGTHSSVVNGHAMLACVDGRVSYRLPGINGKPLQDFLPKDLRGRPLTASQAAKRFAGRVPMDGPLESHACQPQPAYFRGMPTNPSRMLSYLERTQGVRPGDLNDLAKTVGAMLDSDYLLASQQAALYRFLAEAPGITVHADVTDAAGRRGVGVVWPFDGSRAMLIFDPTTYQYLGTATEGIQGQLAGDALLQVAIVDRAGQVPAAAQAPAA